MTTTPPTPPTPLFGQVLGGAQNAARGALDRLLAAEDTTFEQWLALNSLATGTPAPLDDGAFADLTDAGLVAPGPALTPAGEERHAHLRERIAALSASFLADVPPEDVATARRVLETLTAKATAFTA
jgi:hypothetical protein